MLSFFLLFCFFPFWMGGERSGALHGLQDLSSLTRDPEPTVVKTLNLNY